MPDKPPVLAVIPARYESSRLPRKVILPLAGKPLVYHTYCRAKEASLVDAVIIATDDQRVVDALAPYTKDVMITRTDHRSGTDRIAEVAAQREEPLVVNVQGDEPFMDPHTIDRCVQALIDDPEAPMATVCTPFDDADAARSTSNVKVVRSQTGRALYFSRHPVPFVRDGSMEEHLHHYLHLGLYAYRRDFLMRYAQLEPTPLEQLEKLEQLRVLEHGYPIALVETEHKSIGVDTEVEFELAKRLMAERMK